MYFRFTPALRFILPVLILWVTSCEKVIDLNLKGVEAKYVIEGTLSDQPGDCQVLISQTKDFDQDNDFPGISGATVTILSTGDETATTLTETAPGIYKAPALKGTNGETYTLKVIIGENTFTSSSTMPEQVLMDTIYVTEETLFGETWKLANITFPDPAGVANKYRFIQYINSVRTEELFIRDDQLVNGREFETKLYMTPGTDDEDLIHSGDSVKIEMRCIDDNVYHYWFTLEQGATGDGGPVTPANPVTNMEGGALGYFSAYTIQSKSMLVP